MLSLWDAPRYSSGCQGSLISIDSKIVISIKLTCRNNSTNYPEPYH